MTEVSTDLRISAKRRRKEKLGTQPKTERLQCDFIIPKKNRRCPLTRKPDVLYCAEHLKSKDNDIRIPCPVDSRHTVWEKDLKNHIQRCSLKKEEAKKVSWFKLDHNYEGSGLKQEIEIDYLKWIPLVEEVYKEFKDLEMIQLEHKGVEERVNELQNQKHAIQQSSLIAHLDKRELLSNKLNYIEFGCGRAEFSRYLLKSVIHKTSDAADFLLIDRSPSRMKFDSKMIKDCEEHGLTNKVHRIKIDIKDLLIDDVIENEFENKKQFVAISKHLCGAATDLTIQCILKNPKLHENFKGMIVAMCCRHCCDYDMFPVLSKEYLSKRGFEQEGFKHLMKFASWAVNGKRAELDDTAGSDHSSGLTLKEREVVGLKARRIIDESRKFTLESSGYHVELCQYVERTISLENTALIVTKK